MIPDDRTWTRREILKSAAAGSLGSSLTGQVLTAQEPAAADPERIRRENEHPGTRDWMTTNVRIDPEDKVPQPLDRGLHLENQRPARAIDHLSRQHQPAFSLPDRNLSIGILPGSRRTPDA